MGFNPARNGLTGYAKNAFDTAQAAAFFTGFQNCLFGFLTVSFLRFQNPISTTITTMVLSISTIVLTIANDVNAPTATTSIRDGFLNHVGHYHQPSLTLQPLPE